MHPSQHDLSQIGGRRCYGELARHFGDPLRGRGVWGILQTQVDAFQEFGDRERQDDQRQEEMWCRDQWGCCSPLQCSE